MKRSLLPIFAALVVLVMGMPDAFGAQNRRNAAPREALPEELSNVDVKDHPIGSPGEAAGFVQALTGHLVVVRRGGRDAYFAVPGDPVFAGDVLYTLKSSRCRIRLAGQDRITLGADTRLVIDQVLDNSAAGEKESAFHLLRGKAMCYVVRLFRYRRIAFSITTPTAITGVRGTKFGVAVAPEKTAEDLSAEEAETASPTTVYCFEGKVAVYSPVDGSLQEVAAGRSLELDASGAGPVTPTSPEAAERFMQDTTSLPFEDEDNQAEDIVLHEETPNAVTAFSTEPHDDVVRTTPTALSDARPARHQGYFAGMLTKAASGYYGTYRSPAIYDLDAGGAAANGLAYLYQDGSFSDQSRQTTFLETSDGVVTAGLPSSVENTEAGYNAYMEWGTWIQPTAVSDGFSNFVIDNKGYYVMGDATTDARMGDLATRGIAGIYSGGASGTYWTPAGGADMSGQFSTRVDLAAGTLSDFSLSVSGSGHSVSVSGASGLFAGATSQFDINGSTGTWLIDGAGATTKAAEGSLYGANGEAIGGLWEAGNGTGHAVGMFQGTR